MPNDKSPKAKKSLFSRFGGKKDKDEIIEVVDGSDVPVEKKESKKKKEKKAEPKKSDTPKKKTKTTKSRASTVSAAKSTKSKSKSSSSKKKGSSARKVSSVKERHQERSRSSGSKKRSSPTKRKSTRTKKSEYFESRSLDEFAEYAEREVQPRKRAPRKRPAKQGKEFVLPKDASVLVIDGGDHGLLSFLDAAQLESFQLSSSKSSASKPKKSSSQQPKKSKGGGLMHTLNLPMLFEALAVLLKEHNENRKKKGASAKKDVTADVADVEQAAEDIVASQAEAAQREANEIDLEEEGSDLPPEKREIDDLGSPQRARQGAVYKDAKDQKAAELDLQQEVEAEGFLESTNKERGLPSMPSLPGRGLFGRKKKGSAAEAKKTAEQLAKELKEEGIEPLAQPTHVQKGGSKAKTQVKEIALEDELEDEDFLESTVTAGRKKIGAAPMGPTKQKKGLFGFGKKDKEATIADMESDQDFLEDIAERDAEFAAGDEDEDAAPTQRKANRSEAKMREKELKRKEQIQKQRNKKESAREREEEKRWREEAKRREKMLEERRKEAEAKKKAPKDAAAKRNLKLPKKKKLNPLQKVMNALNNFGLTKYRVQFIENLGTMMDAGLPLLDALRALEMEEKQKPVKKMLGRIIIAVEMGSTLWRAMDGQYFFTSQQVSMIRVGEEAGNLVQNLLYLAEQEEKDRALKSKVKTAMIYPIIVLTLLTAIVLGLGMFVLPNLIQVIIGLGVPLPFVTRMIMKFTNLFTQHGSTFLPLMFGGLIIFSLLNKYTSLKIVTQWVVYKIPGVGKLIQEATLSRFGVVTGGLLRAGVPITEALDSIANATTLMRYRGFYYQLVDHIKLGDSFTTSFKRIKKTDKCFPGSVQQLIITGEKSGTLTEVCLKIASIHDKKATEIAEKLPVILEPMLLLFMGALVGVIALGILAPIYSVVGNLG